MRLWIMSDLHQEWPENAWDPAPHAPDFDVIVVSGDVHTPGTAAVEWLADRFAGSRVIYALGNHDLWCDSSDAFTYDDMYIRTVERGAARGIDVLAGAQPGPDGLYLPGQVVIGGVRFLGTTLWTDQRLGAWSRGHAWNTARKGMNDYRRIRRRRTGRHHNIRVEDTVAMHRASRSWIEGCLRVEHDGPTVVVTHHAPSVHSLPDPHMDLAWCYGSNLHEITAAPTAPKLWIHGHIHAHAEYSVGGSGVVANPRGHVEEQTGFIPDFTIEIDHNGRLIPP